MSDTAFITGCNRGLGLEFVRQYLEAGWRVVASCRDPQSPSATALRGLVQAHPRQAELLRLDVTDTLQLDALGDHFAHSAIDLLINNAGIDAQFQGKFGNTEVNGWLETLSVNTIAPLRIMERLVGAVSRGRRKLIVNITSRMASIEGNRTGGSYAYRSSKAALNAVVKSAAMDLKPLEISVVAIHPGWVRTDMGGQNAPTSAAASVKQMRLLIDQLDLAHSGMFLAPTGEAVPW